MSEIMYKESPIFYRVEGKGKVVVLLHGFCCDSTVWDEFAPEIDKHKVVMIDLPGFGKSAGIPNCSIDEMADIVHAVLQQLKMTQYVMIGHSMGGYVSLAYAKKYGSFLTGLGLFHSHPFEDDGQKIDDRNRGIDFITRNGHRLYVKQLFPKLFAAYYTNELLINRLTYKACDYTSEAIISALKAMKARPDQTKTLAEVDCPVLFIVGEKDETIPYEQSLEQAQYPKIADIQIMKQVGHMGMFEHPKDASRIIRKFCEFCYSFETKK